MKNREFVGYLLDEFLRRALTETRTPEEVRQCFLDVFLNSPELFSPDKTISVDRLRQTYWKLYECGAEYTAKCYSCEYADECAMILMAEFMMGMIRFFKENPSIQLGDHPEINKLILQ